METLTHTEIEEILSQIEGVITEQTKRILNSRKFKIRNNFYVDGVFAAKQTGPNQYVFVNKFAYLND